MDHDAILRVHESEKVKIDHEASQIAERAAMALRQSRQLRSIDSVQVPTWTGRSGSAGAPAAHRRRFGSTSIARLASSSSAANQAKPSDGQVAIRASLGLARLAPLKTFLLECISDMLNHQVQLSDSSQ
jgi:DNA excision repair protein ERCC-6